MFLAYFNGGDNSWNHRFRYLHVWIHVSILSEFLNDFEYFTMPSASKIFTGYRALGYVSNHVPLAIRYQEKTKEHYVITSVGKSFHTYNVSMSLLSYSLILSLVQFTLNNFERIQGKSWFKVLIYVLKIIKMLTWILRVI